MAYEDLILNSLFSECNFNCKVVISVLLSFYIPTVSFHTDTGCEARFSIDQSFKRNYSFFSMANGYSDACQKPCKCQYETFTPVCGIDNVVYYSPCHAGCTDVAGMVRITRMHFFYLSCVLYKKENSSSFY